MIILSERQNPSSAGAEPQRVTSPASGDRDIIGCVWQRAVFGRGQLYSRGQFYSRGSSTVGAVLQGRTVLQERTVYGRGQSTGEER